MFCCSSRDEGKKSNNASRVGMPLSGGVNPQQHGQPAWQNMPGKPLGVGIVFQPDSTGALHVKALATGGPAERCGLVNVGDVLHEIDGHHVYRKPVAALAPLILGQEGTVVKLGLQRGTLQRLVYVELRRSMSVNAQPAPANVNPAAAKLSMHVPQGAKLSHYSGPGEH